MKIRLLTLWDELRSSFWFVPALLALLAIGLSSATLALDDRLAQPVIQNAVWIWGGTPEGARSLLSTVAGSTITVAGVVFSITIVALSLASTQFGPRLLRQFMGNRTNQIVLGTFIATFIYCLLILRAVRSGDEGGAFVPHVSVSVSLLLVLSSLGVLIYFIHHTARSMQAPVLMAEVAADLFQALDRSFPAGLGSEPPGGRPSPDVGPPGAYTDGARSVPALADGYLQAIDNESLLQVATECDLVLTLKHRPGHFVHKDSPLLVVWPGERLTEAVGQRVQRGFVIGKYRTGAQDIEFLIDQLVEVAIRALSPGINDIFTALSCVDWLGAGLRRLVARPFPAAERYDEHGRLRVCVEHPQRFSNLLDAAFNLIRQNARKDVAVQVRLLQTLSDVASAAPPSSEVRRALLRHAQMIERSATAEKLAAADAADIQQLYQEVLQRLGAV